MLFTDWYEPGFKAGGPIRSCVNFAAQMKADHEVYVFTGDRDFGDEEPYSGISANEWMEKDGIHLFYASPAALNWENMLVQIQRVKPGFLYLNSMYSRYFTVYPLLMKRLGLIKAKVILAPRGMLQEGALQFKGSKKKKFLTVLKLLGIPKRIHVHATDEQERLDVNRYLPGIKSVSVIPNFSALSQPAPVFLAKHKGELRVVFISRVSPKKNLLFFLSLLTALPSTLRLFFTIRGAVEDEGYWKQCLEVIGRLPQHIQVNFEGPVEYEEVTRVIQQHHLFVLPTLGENFGHAIFEALSAGRPVLISDQTPWRNLPAQHAGWDLPLADEPGFIRVLQELADMDDAAFQPWSTGAWQYAKAFTAHSDLKSKYKALFS